MVPDGVGAGSPWGVLHPALDIFLSTWGWWLSADVEGCGAHGGREGDSPAGQVSCDGPSGRVKLSKKPRGGHHRGEREINWLVSLPPLLLF